MTIAFENTYANLPKNFFTEQSPAPVRKPVPILINENLAEFLSISVDWIKSEKGLGMLSGNSLPKGATQSLQFMPGISSVLGIPNLAMEELFCWERSEERMALATISSLKEQDQRLTRGWEMGDHHSVQFYENI